MNKIAVPKNEYRRLRRQADVRKKIAGSVHALLLRDSVSELADDFRKTGLYEEMFVSDLEQGLRRSFWETKKPLGRATL